MEQITTIVILISKVYLYFRRFEFLCILRVSVVYYFKTKYSL